jgi:hypothetical protein
VFIWDKYLAAHMIPADFTMAPKARCQRTKPPSYVRYAALAAEPFVHFSGISKDDCFVSSLVALVPWRHLASLVQGGHRPGVQIVRQRRLGLFNPR